MALKPILVAGVGRSGTTALMEMSVIGTRVACLVIASRTNNTIAIVSVMMPTR